MKKVFYIIVFIGVFIGSICAQSVKDTLNFTDANDMKQGHWITAGWVITSTIMKMANWPASGDTIHKVRELACKSITMRMVN